LFLEYFYRVVNNEDDIKAQRYMLKAVSLLLLHWRNLSVIAIRHHLRKW